MSMMITIYTTVIYRWKVEELCTAVEPAGKYKQNFWKANKQQVKVNADIWWANKWKWKWMQVNTKKTSDELTSESESECTHLISWQVKVNVKASKFKRNFCSSYTNESESYQHKSWYIKW